jgi:hypothetical protein
VTDPTFALPTGVAAAGHRLLVTNSQFGRTPPGLPFTVSSVPVVTASVRTHVRLDPRADEYPEGAVADRAGNLYVSMIRLAEIWKVTPERAGQRPRAAASTDCRVRWGSAA